MGEQADKSWKVKLRYGLLKTPYSHFTVLADGVAVALDAAFQCPPGPAFMSMKCWCSSSEEAIDMTRVIGGHVGYRTEGRVQVYDTEPEQAPREAPHGYDIGFTAYQK